MLNANAEHTVSMSFDRDLIFALTAVAQEVARLLQHANPVQADGSNHAETIAIRAIESEYSQILIIETLTEGELESNLCQTNTKL